MTVIEQNEDLAANEAYNTGYEAHARGEDRIQNPYEYRTWNHEQWNLGWDTAEAE